MVKIETYTAQRSLQPGNTPSTNYSSAVAEELVGVGRATEDAASVFIERQQQRENFSAENNYRKLKLELAEDLRRDTEAAPPDGADLHANFLQNTFRPKRDAFLGTVPERLRPQFEAVLNDQTGPDAYQWSTSAATAERDLNYGWQRNSIFETQNQLATAISMDPEGYDTLLADGEALIKASSLPTAEREKLMTDWEHMAQVSLVNKLLETDPQRVLRELGVDARQLSPTTQFSVLSREVQWQESNDNPNAVSGKGALGLMQVMPDTAREIAGNLGDTQFPTDKEDIAEYLSNPYVNKTYGEFYLREQLKTFAGTRNPIETALVAYNAGPGTAQQWVESGYDDSILSKETRDYKTEIMARISAPGAKGDPSSVKFEGADLKGTSGDLQYRVADAFSSIGLDKVRVNSGSRTPEENEAAGGADHSQHLEGNAMDIDVSGMKHAERVELIKALSAAGVTGIGVYANSIHADLGGRRAWGPSHGADSIPKWASGVLSEHLNGTTPPIRRVAGRFGSMPYDTRQQFTTKADQLIAAQASRKSDAVQQVQVKRQRDNELEMIRRTGQGDPNFDETSISTILGPDDYLKFNSDRDTALRSFTAKQGVPEMSIAQMEQRYNDYNPRPGADFEADTRVQAALRQEIDRVQRLRATSPDRAALEVPEVQGVADALTAKLNAGEASPQEIQDFVSLMLNTQTDLDIPPNARAPVPREWAVQIGKLLSALPRPAQPTAQQRASMTPEELDKFRAENKADVYAAIRTEYEALNAQFGQYTDEVVTYALSEYKGVDKKRAEALMAWANAAQQGTGQVFGAADVERETDMSQSNTVITTSPIPFLPFFQVPYAVPNAAGQPSEVDPDAALRNAGAVE